MSAISDLAAWFRSFWPQPMAADRWARLRGAVGAAIGILATGLISRLVLGPGIAAPLLIAPMGASAVLLYGVPASPLAQPWSIIGGNLVAGFIGITCALYIQEPVLAAAMAVGLAIGAMFALRCLHPPSGAVALTAVLGGPVIHDLGYWFLVVPLGLNSVLLLFVALIFNNVTRHRYPHAAPISHVNVHLTRDPRPSDRLGFVPADLDDVLKGYHEVLDISREDLETLFLQTEMHAYRRRFGDIRCSDIMSRDVIAVDRRTELRDAWNLLQEHKLQVLPVLEPGSQRVVGLIKLEDFLEQMVEGRLRFSSGRLRRLLRRRGKHLPLHAGDIMTTSFQTAQVSTPVVELVPVLADGDQHQVPILDQAHHLVGLVTQSDLLVALYRGRLAETTGLAETAEPMPMAT
ncbi:MAG TPA: HPP family protein [Dongiaceae bacterium]